ncbi:MAG: RNA polymerase sigma factor [Flavobacteriaceae bacterium]|nr:RNA polymerase sigma factor [Flavobacteriaceae bacterium]
MKDNSKNICNPKTFETVFTTYAEDIKRFLYFKYGHLEIAEDVMQDTFVKVWQNCKEVRYETVKSLLYTIANNLFLNIKKHEKVVRKNQPFLVQEKDIETPEFLMQEKEFLLKVETVIASLTKKQREVFLLSRIDNKKYKEIAIILGISIKAVEKRMHKALVVIREKIGNI